MKGSRSIILVVIIAVAGVVIAKQKMKAPPAVTEQAAETGEPAPGSADRPTENGSQPSTSSQAERNEPSSSVPIPPPGANGDGKPPGAVVITPPTPSPQPPAPRPTDVRPTADGSHDGPLPGSELANCLKNRLPTMADFGRTWCKPCKAMVPILKQAAKDYEGKANILFVDLGKYAKLGRNYRIRAMPTQIFFDAQGNEVGRHMGYMGSKDIEKRLAELGVEK